MAGRTSLTPLPELGVIRAYLSALLVVGGVVSWRRKTYFTGGFDSVVILKALLVCIALGLALSIPRRVDWSRVPVSILVLISVYSVETALGGWAANSMFAALVLSLRLLLTASVLIVLALKFAPMPLFHILRNAMVGFALVSIGTGSSGSGRLTGGIPPLSPNELALLCGVSVLSIAWVSLNGNGSVLHAVTFVVLLAAIFLTGSRTGLAVLIVALFAMLVQSRRIPIFAFVSAVSIIPVVVFIVGSTGIISSFVDRGGSGNVTTLSSRTIAWGAAFGRGGTFFQQQFGGGLALKQIPVAGQYWNQQTLDSTWISALVQGGNLGLVLLAVWSFVALRAAFRAPRPERLLWTGLLVFVVGRSTLESGMLDSSAAFLIFFLVCLVGRRHDEADDSAPAAIEKSRPAATVRGGVR